MKKSKFFVSGMLAAALAFGVILAGCGAGTGSDDPSSLLSGTFGNKTFSVNATSGTRSVRTARNITSDTTWQVSGLLQDGDGGMYDLAGFYDEADNNFSLSTQGDNRGFELSGKRGNGKAKLKNKTGTDWVVGEADIAFGDFMIYGTSDVVPATAFPEEWWGLYDFSQLADMNNNQGVESWMSGNGGDRRGLFVMTLGPYSMDFWPNLDLLRPMYEEINWGDDDQINEALAQNATVQSSFTILEISENAGAYTALLLLTLSSDSPYYPAFDANGTFPNLVTGTTKNGITVVEGYRRVEFTRGNDGKITATLAGDTTYPYPYVFRTAAEALAASFDYSDRASQLVFEPLSW